MKEKKELFVKGLKSSPEEYAFATLLDTYKFDYTFNEKVFIVDKRFNGLLKQYRDTKYTPDFIITTENRTIVVEIKGFMRGDNSLRYRLADRVFTDLGYEFYVLEYRGSVKQGTKGFYNYSAGFKQSTKDLSKYAIKYQNKQEFFTRVLHITK